MSDRGSNATLGWGGIAGLFAAAVLGIALIQNASAKAYPASEGAEWLTQQGYTDVTGGEVDGFNGCGKGNFAREYEATSPQGEHGKKIVCWGLFGKHAPLFGN